jgi:uncharacterized protein
VPVPHGTTESDLVRLDEALQITAAKRLVILGDLFHARGGNNARTFGAFKEWRSERNSLEITLVRGNHDLRSGDPPCEWEVECVDEPHNVGPFICTHDLASAISRAGGRPPGFVLQGHIHPKASIGAPDRTESRRHNGPSGRFSFPCFVLEDTRLILPAFGGFTGGSQRKPRAGVILYPVIDNEVYEVGIRSS